MTMNRVGTSTSLVGFLVLATLVAPSVLLSQSQSSTANLSAQAEQAYQKGHQLEYGEGIPVDYKLAATWLKMAAVANYAPAEYQLGILYKEGSGVEQDYGKAIELYRKAALQNYTPATDALKAFCQYGLGVPSVFNSARAVCATAASEKLVKSPPGGFALSQADLQAEAQISVGVASKRRIATPATPSTSDASATAGDAATNDSLASSGDQPNSPPPDPVQAKLAAEQKIINEISGEEQQLLMDESAVNTQSQQLANAQQNAQNCAPRGGGVLGGILAMSCSGLAGASIGMMQSQLAEAQDAVSQDQIKLEELRNELAVESNSPAPQPPAIEVPAPQTIDYQNNSQPSSPQQPQQQLGPSPAQSAATTQTAALARPQYQTTTTTAQSPQSISGVGANWSGPYTLCAYPPGAGFRPISDQFVLSGDRTCGKWAQCQRTTFASNEVCWQFDLQGHNERPYPGQAYSQGWLSVTWTNQP